MEKTGCADESSSEACQVAGGLEGGVKERWAVRLGSCVDASPLLVWQKGAEDRWRCVIGSHAHNVMCISSR